VWDDNATAGNYKGNSRELWGQEGTSGDADFFGPVDDDFIGLKDDDLRPSLVDNAVAQPRHSPGEKGSGLPGIEGFHKPTGAEASIFKNVHFNTDEASIKDKASMATLERIVDYLQDHPNVALFISGHCDERGPEAYNLSLGSRRADSIRALLVKRGIDGERLHTISYGKERPLEVGHSPEVWSKNRRGEFRLYAR
jgi:peptidoglycan-associated lipoprotein